MLWHEHLYLGKNCIRRANRLKYKITNRLVHQTVYLITLPTGGSRVLEMIPSTMLLQKNYPHEELEIVGMAADRREGLELMGELIREAYDCRGDFDIGEYLRTGQEKE